MLVDQKPHQFGHRDRGMGVVKLHRKALMKSVRRISSQEMDPQHVLKRAGDKEVLLGEPKMLADLRFVVGIEDLTDCFGNNLLVDGLVIVPHVKRLKIKGLDGLRL